jgi:hypothetical protein
MTDTDHISFPFDPSEAFMVDHDSFVERCLDEGLLSEDEYEDPINDGHYFGYAPTCVHEAGHAVVAYVLGRPIESVSAEEWGDDGIETADGAILYIGFPGGLTRYADEPELAGTEFAARLYRDAVTAASGPLAHHMYTGEAIERIMDPANADPNHSSDWHLINNDWTCTYADIMFAEPPFEMPQECSDDDFERFLEWQGELMAEVERKLWVDAKRILRANWDLVEGLAAVLIHNSYLDGPEVYEVFDRIQARRAASR